MQHNRLTVKEFVDRAIVVHGDKYDYSNCNPDNINNRCKLEIVCKVHGSVEINSTAHLNGSKCPKCVKV